MTSQPLPRVAVRAAMVAPRRRALRGGKGRAARGIFALWFVVAPHAFVAGETDDRDIAWRHGHDVVPAGVLDARAVLAALPAHGFAVDHVHRPLTGAPFLTTAATSGTPGR